MVTSGKESKVNIISEPSESSEDRGPLVEDDDLDHARAKIEDSVGKLGSSAEDVLAFLESDDNEEEEEESYLDSRIPLARDTRPMIAAWHEYKNAMAQVKTSYKLLKVETELGGSDGQSDQRREGIVQSASRIKRSLDVIECDLKDAFPKLVGVAWLTRSELLVMPTWMHKLMGVSINASDEEKVNAQSQLQQTLDGENEA
jgi:hypothetical protein